MAPALREPPTRPLLRQLLYRHGRPAVTAAVILAHARWGRELEREIGWTDQQTLLTSWPIPHLPISGADLMAAGLSPGPAIGQRLARAESAWIDADFALARDALLAIALA
jgi:poly(A) polymerase